MGKVAVLWAKRELRVTDCRKATTELVGPVQSSLQTSRQLKADGGKSYQYVRQRTSWTGSGFELTVGVAQDAPATRSYKGFTTTNGLREVTETWNEAGDDLGLHALDGYEAIPVEALYARCLNEVLERDSITHEFTLTFHDNGLLQACHSRPAGCQDDCSDGVDLAALSFAN